MMNVGWRLGRSHHEGPAEGVPREEDSFSKKKQEKKSGGRSGIHRIALNKVVFKKRSVDKLFSPEQRGAPSARIQS